MKQYVQADLEADRKVANTFAELIIGGSLASTEITSEPREDQAVAVGGDAGETA
jgi:hypothetical protein